MAISGKEYECDLHEGHAGPHSDCRFEVQDESFRTVDGSKEKNVGHNVDLCQMIGAPARLECPKCRRTVASSFDDYDIECGQPNDLPGQWFLDAFCPECEHAWTHEIDLVHPFGVWSVAVAMNSKEHGFHQEGVNNAAPSWCANLHGEISELWEAYRKGTLDKPCDKKVELTCAEEELADIIIRTLDIAWQLGRIDVDKAVRLKHEYNRGRPYLHGGKKA